MGIGWQQLFLAYKIINRRKWYVRNAHIFQKSGDVRLVAQLDKKFQASDKTTKQMYNKLKTSKTLTPQGYFRINRITNLVSSKVRRVIGQQPVKQVRYFTKSKAKKIGLIFDKTQVTVIWNRAMKDRKNLKYSIKLNYADKKGPTANLLKKSQIIIQGQAKLQI